jgi:HD-GYP domain-containing protein (c-di-GMP phosphodiesterase class II)
MTTSMAKDDDVYIAISPATICPSRVPKFPLYLRDGSSRAYRLYREGDDPFDADNVRRLTDRGAKHLYVTLADQERYQRYLREYFGAVVGDESLTIQQRFGCLNEVVRDVLGEVFTRRDTGRMVETAGRLAAQTVELICRDDAVAAELLHVLHHDYHTFTHSANVSFYCVLLAREWGIDDQHELQQIGAGALLHDVGKLEIPETILKKRGRLDTHEWDIIRQHPTTGLRLLGRGADLTYGQLMMVYQHHERMDGTGYPVGVSQSQIHPWAQLCAVVDVYEALTSYRPYRPALPKREAVDILERHMGTRLNEGMWQCWKTIIQVN